MNSSYLRPFARFQAALAWARCRAISALCASRSLRSARLTWIRMNVAMPLTAMATATPAQTIVTISVDSTESVSLWLFVMLIVAWTVVSLVIFHWVLVPVHEWLVERLS